MIGALAIRSKRRPTKPTQLRKLRPQISTVTLTSEDQVQRVTTEKSDNSNKGEINFFSTLSVISFICGIIILVPASIANKDVYYYAAECCVSFSVIFLIIYCVLNGKSKSRQEKESASKPTDLVKISTPNTLSPNEAQLRHQNSAESRDSAKINQNNNSPGEVAISMDSFPIINDSPVPEQRVKTPYVHEATKTPASISLSITLPPNTVAESLTSLAEEGEENSKKSSTNDQTKNNNETTKISKQNSFKSRDSAIHVSSESSDFVKFNPESLNLPLVST